MMLAWLVSNLASAGWGRFHVTIQVATDATVCTAPNITGYNVSEHSLNIAHFNVSVRCSSGYIPSGVPRAIPCNDTGSYTLEGCVNASMDVCPCDIFCTDYDCGDFALKSSSENILCPNGTCTNHVCCDGALLGNKACTSANGTELSVLDTFLVSLSSCTHHCMRHPECTAFTHEGSTATCKLHSGFAALAAGASGSSCFVRHPRFSAWPELLDTDCPDSTVGNSRYVNVRGSPGAILRETSVTSCAECAQSCAEASDCHGFQCVAGVCRHVEVPIPAKSGGYMCVPKPNTFGSALCAGKYETRMGFVPQNASSLLASHNLTCAQCSTQCTADGACGLYQCSDSWRVCALYTNAKHLVPIGILELLVCVKFPTAQCALQDGTMHHHEECLCGTDGTTICSKGQRCRVTSRMVVDGGTQASLVVSGECLSLRDCEVCTRVGCSSVRSEVCADNGQTYTNRCEAECVGHQVLWLGSCDNATQCNETNVDDEIVCGADGATYLSACFANATTIAHNGPCADQQCTEGATNCFCNTHFCANSISLPTYCSQNLTCLPLCDSNSGEEEVWETDCFCPNTTGRVCHDDMYCVASNGTCHTRPRCKYGDTRCFCQYSGGETFCRADTYCADGCVPTCDDDSGRNGAWQTDCFCPNPSAIVCTNATYCAADNATCVPGCPHHDGLTKNNDSCICGTDLTCPDSSYCYEVDGSRKCSSARRPWCNYTLAEEMTTTECVCGTAVCKPGDYCVAHAEHDEECQPDFFACPTNGTACVSAICACGDTPCPRGDVCVNTECYALSQRCSEPYEAGCLCGTGAQRAVCGPNLACTKPGIGGACAPAFAPRCPAGYHTLTASLQPSNRTFDACATICSQDAACSHFVFYPNATCGLNLPYDTHSLGVVCEKDCSHSGQCSSARPICDETEHTCRACFPTDCAADFFCDGGCVHRSEVVSLCNNMTSTQGNFSQRVCTHDWNPTACVVSSNTSCRDFCAADGLACTNAWMALSDCHRGAPVACAFAHPNVCRCAA